MHRPTPPRPWAAHYRDPSRPDIEQVHDSLLGAFAANVNDRPDGVAIRYFDGVLTYADIDRRADALAARLQRDGFAAGDRVAIFLQNDPDFVVALVAAWKAGGVAVMVNAMNKADELRYLLADSGSVALVCLDELYESVAREVVEDPATGIRSVVTCSGWDHQSVGDPRVLAAKREPIAGTTRLADLDWHEPLPVDAPQRGDTAVLTYTSGTTGMPKGAMGTHGNLAFNAQTYLEWMDLSERDVILGVAPLFHITGLVGHIGAALLARCPLVLTHRFDTDVVLETIRRERPTMTVGSITVFLNLLHSPALVDGDFRSFRAIYSGGAPISPAVNERFKTRTGQYIHNIYGLTETNSPSHAVPLGVEAPVDAGGGVSVGLPVFNTVARIADPDGKTLPPGEIGEILVAGPQVIPGYWNRPEESNRALADGELRTGDVGFMNAGGWFFVVDRIKDMINASGFKVWPREVEDVLYQHPAVREVAVVGISDEYRGETVKAFVVRHPGHDVEAADVIDFARARMAAYKYPRTVEFVDELPKNAAGKVLRRTLRDLASTPTAPAP